MNKTILRIINLVIGSCRGIMGLLVIKAGYDLTRTQGAFSSWTTESSFGGPYIMLMGLAFLVLAIFPNSFGGSG